MILSTEEIQLLKKQACPDFSLEADMGDRVFVGTFWSFDGSVVLKPFAMHQSDDHVLTWNTRILHDIGFFSGVEIYRLEDFVSDWLVRVPDDENETVQSFLTKQKEEAKRAAKENPALFNHN